MAGFRIFIFDAGKEHLVVTHFKSGDKCLHLDRVSAWQRRAHEVAAHDAWFRAEVEQALSEANGPAARWIPQEDVKRQSAGKRTEWLAKTVGGKAAS